MVYANSIHDNGYSIFMYGHFYVYLHFHDTGQVWNNEYYDKRGRSVC